MAVLYGSVARGDEDAGSDLDLLVGRADDHPVSDHRLATHLENVIARKVDVAHLARVEANAPLLLDRVLEEGRVLVDRDGRWQELHGRRRAIRARAQRAYRPAREASAGTPKSTRTWLHRPGVELR